MSRVSNILLDKEILLESGTNELEMLVFTVADFTFGINVAKVREILPATRITSLPRAHRSIRGVFKLRNQVIPCVSLLDHLNIRPTRSETETTMILADFNQQQTAFLVDQVERIHRLSWENILSVPGIMAMSNTPVTSMARCENRLIVMLDFEMIIDQVTERFFRQNAVANPDNAPRETARLVLADDSPTVREAIGITLRESGYTNLRFFENGADAWDWISSPLKAGGRVEDICDLLISDVEMPQVDGFHLTKRIKEHPELKRLPVMLYSSIVTPDNQKKGRSVGADAQISKPELAKVVELADQLISAARQRQGAPELAMAQAADGAATSPAAAATAAHGALQPQALAAGPAKPTFPPLPTQQVPSAAEEPLAKPSKEPSPTKKTSTAATQTAKNAPKPAAPAAVPTSPRVDPHIWHTFHRELQDRVARLQALIAQAESTPPTADLINELFRTLHTIKSAAMVVPVEPVARTTHLVEGLLEAARSDASLWPQGSLRRYLAWLEELSDARGTQDNVLTRAADLELALTETLAAALA
jgi:two-component system, chemotaxis family, chemotaxis protein CheV